MRCEWNEIALEFELRWKKLLVKRGPELLNIVSADVLQRKTLNKLRYTPVYLVSKVKLFWEYFLVSVYTVDGRTDGRTGRGTAPYQNTK